MTSINRIKDESIEKGISSRQEVSMDGAVCPLPLPHSKKIVMGHGSGGKMSHDLIKETFLPPFDNPALRAGDDAGVIRTGTDVETVISTDSHVVWPLFFPGGDIGKLAVCGTVNDVSMMGATPQYLTAGFILEEGLEVEVLERIVTSMKTAASEAGVQIVSGDTKVVQQGKVDGLFINTAGIGIRPASIHISGSQAKPGDLVLLSGPIGNHGIAVLCARGDLGIESDIISDIAPLNGLVAAMLQASKLPDGGTGIHVLRDPTRGGLATSLNEIATQSHVRILINEDKIPVHPAVMAACEILGFDPLYIANEGKLIAIVDHRFAESVLEQMQQNRYGKESKIIGEVLETSEGMVLMKTTIGSTRVVDVLSGEILPRIC
jgi:hydrogenase expression/formation protein HypE